MALDGCVPLGKGNPFLGIFLKCRPTFGNFEKNGPMFRDIFVEYETHV